MGVMVHELGRASTPPFIHISWIGTSVACDLNPYPLLLEEKGDDCEMDCP
jgi:hypothetical protein